ncbi:hypothetical protein ACFX2I_008132 [Malus domestica]
MRFLLGWIGPQALDSDVQIFPVLSKNRSSFAEFTEINSNPITFVVLNNLFRERDLKSQFALFSSGGLGGG